VRVPERKRNGERFPAGGSPERENAVTFPPAFLIRHKFGSEVPNLCPLPPGEAVRVRCRQLTGERGRGAEVFGAFLSVKLNREGAVEKWYFFHREPSCSLVFFLIL